MLLLEVLTSLAAVGVYSFVSLRIFEQAVWHVSASFTPLTPKFGTSPWHLGRCCVCDNGFVMFQLPVTASHHAPAASCLLALTLQEKELMNKLHNDLVAVASSISMSTRIFSITSRHSGLDLEHGTDRQLRALPHQSTAALTAKSAVTNPADTAAEWDCQHSQPQLATKQQQQQQGLQQGLCVTAYTINLP